MEQNNEYIWVVSFGIGEVGEYCDYEIDALALDACSSKMRKTLMAKLGKGVFTQQAEAEEWAASQLAAPVKSCGCRCQHKQGCGSSE